MRPAPSLKGVLILLAALAVLGSARPLWAADATDAPPLRIITEDSSPAAFYREGRLVGLSVEIVREVQRELGDETPIEVEPWARAYQTALEQPGVLLFSAARTPAREELFLWIGQLFSVKLMLCGLAGRTFDIKSLDDAKRVARIGVYRGDVRAQYLKDKGFTNLDVASDSLQNFKKLLRGRVDLIAMSDLGLATIARDEGIPVERIRPAFIFGETGMFLLASMGTDPAVVAAWREAFERVRQKGIVERIRRKWM